MKKIKSIFVSLLCASLICLGFTSCENFMKSSEVKNEIIDAIDFNNAKSISVLVQSEPGEGTTVPAGYYSAKQGYEFEISFSETPGFNFEKWAAYTTDNKKTPVTEGVFFEDATSPTTKVIIKNDTVQIKLVPVCSARISTNGEFPKYESLGVSRDTPINVTFTQELNPNSFIFSEAEIPVGAQSKKDKDNNIWAYTLDSQTFFKNISITNADGYSIAQYFTQPQIDETNGLILTIDTDKSNPIDFNSNEIVKTVIVTLSRNIQNKNKIPMGTDKSWRYQINDSTIQKVKVNISCQEGQGSVENTASAEYSIGQRIPLSFTESKDYQFVKWEYDSNKINIVQADDPVNAIAIVLNKTDDTATQITAACVARPRIQSFTPLNTSENPSVGKNSPIYITFNHDLPNDEEFKQEIENISITIGGVPVKSSFKAPVITGSTIYYAVDKSNMLEVTEGQIKTVTVSIPGDFYYLNDDGKKVTYGGNGTTVSYKIDHTTIEKSYISQTIADEDAGNLTAITNTNGFSMDQTISISFVVNEGFKFERWIASSNELPEGEDISDYILFGDETNPKTTITFIKPLNGIKIEALCPHLPEFNFKLTGSNGKFSPSKGIQTCTQTYTYPLSFEPDSDYEFLRWEIYDTETGNIIPDNTYIKIGNLKENETTYSFVSKPDDSIKLAIRPVIAERPQIISYSPLFDVAGVNTDTSIRIIFDYDMDASSIYYTEDEISEMKNNGEADAGACKEGNVYYGYTKNGELFYKSIILKNNDGGANLYENYNHPVFENPRALVISAKRENLLDPYTQVLVTLNKNIFYKEDDVNIAMATSKKWIFQLKEGQDSDDPTIATSTFKFGFSESNLLSIKTQDLTAENATPWSVVDYDNDKKLYINLTVNDAGSGLSDYFTLVTKKIYDENYDLLDNPEEIKKLCYYQTINPTTKESLFNKTLDLSDYEEGVYSAYLEIKDITGNTLTYPTSGYFYFAIDETAPVVSNNPVIEIDSEDDTKLNLSWDCKKDYKTTIEYQKQGDDTWSTISNITTSSTSIPNLDTGNIYNLKFTFEDYNGHSISKGPYTKDVKLGKVKNIRDLERTYDHITIGWDAPVGNCDGYNISYTAYVNGKLTKIENYNIEGKNNTSITIQTSPTQNSLSTGTVNGYLRPITINSITVKYGNKESEAVSYKTYTRFVPTALALPGTDTSKYHLVVGFRGYGDDPMCNNSTVQLWSKIGPDGTWTKVADYVFTNTTQDSKTIKDISRNINQYYKLTWTIIDTELNKTFEIDSIHFYWDVTQGLLPVNP